MSNETPEKTKTSEAKKRAADGYLNYLENRVSQLMHNVPQVIHDVFQRHRRTAFERHPFLFSTLGLLGLVITWQAMDDIIEKFAYFDKNPEILLIIGLAILLCTGRLYRQLDTSGM